MSKYILDTHVLCWALENPKKLSKKARDKIENADYVAISSMTLLELGMMANKGDLIPTEGLKKWIDLAIDRLDVDVIPINSDIADGMYQIREQNPDIKAPGDRTIMATARYTGIPLITKDEKITKNKIVTTIW